MSNRLRVFIDDFTSSQSHVVLVNADQSDDRVVDIRRYFERYSFTVETETWDESLPDSFLVLTDGERCLAAIDLETLHDYLIDSLESGSFDRRYANDLKTTSAVETFLTNLDENVYQLEHDGKIPLIEVSRVIERRAGDDGTGSLHTGFQRLSRLRDERGTWDTYRRIADRGVDVNVYGVPDWRPPKTESMRFFGDEEGTHVGDFWFVVYDGGDQPETGGVLLAEEVSPGVYTGVWSFDSDSVAEVVEYVESELQPQLVELHGSDAQE